MAENNLTFTEIPPPESLSVWQSLVAKSLRGGSAEALATTTLDGLVIPPLATNADWPTPDATGLPGQAPYTRGHIPQTDWRIRAFIEAPDAATANTEALEAQALGATALHLRLQAPGQSGIALHTQADFAVVFAGIDLSTISISIDAGLNAEATSRALLQTLAAHTSHAPAFLGLDVFASAARTGFAPHSFDIALSQTASLAKAAHIHKAGAVRAITIDTRPYHNAGASPAQELGIAIAAGIAHLRALTQAGLSAGEASTQISFLLVTDADFFTSLTKLRAFRRVWARVLEASGCPEAATHMHMAAITSERMLTKRDLQVNTLRIASAAFAAALGGADAITTLAYSVRLGRPTAAARRLALTTQALLLHEAGAARITDPAGGSYGLELRTEELAQKAWGFLQQIEAQGGVATALCNGFIREQINTSWKILSTDIAHRRQALTGISEFPWLDEPPAHISSAFEPHPEVVPLAAATNNLVPVTKPLPQHTLDEPFEALRAASDAHLARTGTRPQILLMCMGDETDFAARLGFTRALFEAGGIECRAASGLADAEAAADALLEHGLSLAVLCSSDAQYTTAGPAFAQALKQAGVRYLYLAGIPRALEAPMREAGIDEFVMAGLDAPELLQRAQQLLGVGE